MKIILFFEIVGLLLFGSIVISEVQTIQDAGPLPQSTTLPVQQTREEVATIDLNSTQISILYHEYTGYSLIHPVTKISFHSTASALKMKAYVCLLIIILNIF